MGFKFFSKTMGRSLDRALYLCLRVPFAITRKGKSSVALIQHAQLTGPVGIKSTLFVLSLKRATLVTSLCSMTSSHLRRDHVLTFLALQTPETLLTT